jgi:hypothetical protein
VESFSRIHVAALPNERTVLLLSGDGYTPYHAVVMLEADGTIAYQEHAAEHAFALQALPSGSFQVEARSQTWEYSIPGR